MSVEATVRRTITAVIEEEGGSVDSLALEDGLVSIGLTSLDLAAVVAMLEKELSVDPFLEFRSITSVRTVGDLCSAYEDYLESGGDDSPDDSALHEARLRATRGDDAG